MKKVVYVFAIVSFLFAQLGAAERFIVNGQETDYSWKEAPALLGLISPDSMYICTGVFIDKKVILTAGHCVFNEHIVTNIWATGGAGDIIVNADSREFEIKVKDIVLHPDYKGSVYGNPLGTDLALVLLEEPVKEAKVRKVISTNEINPEAKKIAVGFGITSQYSNNSGIQREGEVQVIQRVKNGANAHVIEVGNPAGLCSGDSGGPIFVQNGEEYEVFGITSYVDVENGESCRTDGGSYVVDIIHYRGWIMDTAKKWLGHFPGNEEAGTCGNGIVEGSEMCDNPEDPECTTNCTKENTEIQEIDCMAMNECANNCPDSESRDNCIVGCLYSGDKEAIFKLDQLLTCVFASCDNPTNFCVNQYCEKEANECTGDKTGTSSIVCGNGKLELGEMCDDSNTKSKDGCDSSCQKELPPGNYHSCSETLICLTLESTGFEDLSICQSRRDEKGWALLQDLAECASLCSETTDSCFRTRCKEEYEKCLNQKICGNGIIEGKETCDDGNRLDDDSCDSKCGIKESSGKSSGCSVLVI